MLCALAAAPAAAVPWIDARAILTWRELDAGEQKTSGARQTFDLGLRRAISDPLGVRLWFRADASDSSFELADQRSSTDFEQLKVGGEVTLTYPTLQLVANWDSIATDLSGDRSTQRDLTRSYATLNWRPDGLPDLSIEAEDRGFSDALRGDDDSDERLQAILSETFGPLFLSAGARTEERTNAGGAVRDTDDLFARAAVNGSFLDERLDANAQVYLLDSRIGERGPPLGGQPVAERIPISTASTGVDPSPEDSRDRPLEPAGQLIDGFFFATGIDLGPTGESFRNVALDLGRFADVDELRLYVRDADDDPVPVGGAIDWRVYTSTDTLDWTPLAAGVLAAFDPGRSLYEIRFPRTSTRYLKVVAFGVNLVETFLVEVEAFDSEALGVGDSRRTDSRAVSADAAVTGRPSDRVTLFWSANWNELERAPDDGQETRTEDSTQYASLLVEAASWADVQVRWERRRAEQDRSDLRQDFRQLAAELILRPRAGLDLRLEALESDEERNLETTRTEGMALKSHASLWRALDVRLDAGELRSTTTGIQGERSRRYVNGWAIAQLTDSITWTNAVSRSRTTLTSGGPEEGDDTRWSTELFWRPGPQLGLGARIGRASRDDFSATTRNLRLEWNPFRGGALRFGALYNEDVDTFAQRTLRRLSLSPGWTLNRHASLDCDYTVFEYDDGSPRRTSLLVNLTLRD